MALAQAGSRAAGATLHVTLEPCAHDSERGPACAALASAAGLAQAVIGLRDPDPRTAGRGMAQLEAAGIAVTLTNSRAARASLAGYLTQRTDNRPYVTCKLAVSLDGCIALADGTSRWITGSTARAHVHRERARHDAILVGGGTLRADRPRLDVRLPGFAQNNPRRLVLTRGKAPAGWQALANPAEIAALHGVQYLFVEGGALAAAAFLTADLVDRLLIYRAPIIIGGGRASISDIGLIDLAAAHGRWRSTDHRQLGSDSYEAYERVRCSPE